MKKIKLWIVFARWTDPKSEWEAIESKTSQEGAVAYVESLARSAMTREYILHEVEVELPE